ncbi:MAG: hypothetical protein WCP79_06210 [Bacillota bacterium]
MNEYRKQFANLTLEEKKEEQNWQNKQLLIPAVIYNVILVVGYVLLVFFNLHTAGLLEYFTLVLLMSTAIGIYQNSKIAIVGAAVFSLYTFYLAVWRLGVYDLDKFLHLVLFIIPVVVYCVAWQACDRMKK